MTGPAELPDRADHFRVPATGLDGRRRVLSGWREGPPGAHRVVVVLDVFPVALTPDDALRLAGALGLAATPTARTASAPDPAPTEQEPDPVSTSYPPPNPQQWGPPPAGWAPPQPPSRRRRWPWLVAGAVVLLVVFSSCVAALSGGTDPATPGVTPAAPTAPGAPAAAPLGGDQVPIGQPWTSDNGNVVVVGQPRVQPAREFSTADRVVVVPITLQNNGDEEWSVVFTSFAATLGGRPLQEDYLSDAAAYSTPLAPGADVTLDKTYELGAETTGELEVTVTTLHGTGFWTGAL